MKKKTILYPLYMRNIRIGLATNSSSTHSVIYKNKDDMFKDMNIFTQDFYDRYDRTIATTKEAKIKYILAAIYYKEGLAKIMSEIYPQMKEYFPLIRKQVEINNSNGHEGPVFGMYFRGNFSFSNNIEASVEYLRSIIEDDDIVIVGGSDEENFVYEIVDNHLKAPMPEDVGYENRKIYKNGNYWLGYAYSYIDDNTKNYFCGRARFARDNDVLIPEHPELIDLKITDKCSHGCPFCFQGSTPNGKGADIQFLRHLIRSLGEPDSENYKHTEFSIGGGNILEYSHLDELLNLMHKMGHIVNLTIKADDCDEVIKNYGELFMSTVNGIGVSVFSLEDAEKAIKLREKLHSFYVKNHKSTVRDVVMHVIPEYIGYDNTLNILSLANKHYIRVLYLGYKTNERGKNFTPYRFTENEFVNLISKNNEINSIDTTFANTYIDFIKKHFEYEKCITLNEGEYSMYIDAVNGQAYKSSYQLDKPYNMLFTPWDERDVKPMYSIVEAFTEIRKDGGFKTYEADAKKYYD